MLGTEAAAHDQPAGCIPEPDCFYAGSCCVFHTHSGPAPACTPSEGACGTERNSCLRGNPYDAGQTSDRYIWKCPGTCGGNFVNCTSGKPLDGVCGTRNSCLQGSFRERSDTSYEYRWYCGGRNGGRTVACNASKSPPVDGRCSGSVNRCLSGFFRERSDTDSYHRWFCDGRNGGRNEVCDAPKSSDGVCGTTINNCSRGAFRDRPDTDSYHRWYCDGRNGGGNVACLVLKPPHVDGRCSGSVNRCLSGFFRERSDTDSYHRWFCDGSNGGRNDICDAPKSSDGRCGTAIDSCSQGVFRDRSDTDSDHRWFCDGLNGGRDDVCDAPKSSDGRCSDFVNRCLNGAFRDRTDTDSDHRWFCDGRNGGRNDECDAPKASDGRCGLAVDSCDNGRFRDRSDTSSDYRWYCDGVNGGSVRPTLKEQTSGRYTVGDNIYEVRLETIRYANNLQSAKFVVNGEETRYLSPPGLDPYVLNDGTLISVIDITLPLNTLQHGSVEFYLTNMETGGDTASCSRPRSSVDGLCSDSLNRCSRGAFRDGPDTDSDHLWHCVGVDGGRNHTCYKSKSDYVDGICSSSVVDECLQGVFRDRSDTSSDHRWYCDGLNGGGNHACYISRSSSSADGACGTARNSCLGGTRPNDRAYADTASEYRWRCDGLNGGSNSGMCRADKPDDSTEVDRTSSGTTYDGVCGTRNNCSQGVFRDRSDTFSDFRWYCDGVNGGSIAACYVSKSSADGACGTARNSCLGGARANDLAYPDSASEYRWRCDGLDGTSNSGMCRADKPRAGGLSDLDIEFVKVNGDKLDGSDILELELGQEIEVDVNVSAAADLGAEDAVEDIEVFAYIAGFEYDVDGMADRARPFDLDEGSSEVKKLSLRIPERADEGYYTLRIFASNRDRDSITRSLQIYIGSADDELSGGVCGSDEYACTAGRLNLYVYSDTSSEHRWRCDGLNGGSNSGMCRAPKSVDGACGQILYTCLSGQFRYDFDSDKWNCDGINGGLNATCSPQIIDGDIVTAEEQIGLLQLLFAYLFFN